MKPEPIACEILNEFGPIRKLSGVEYGHLAQRIARALLEVHQRGRREGMEEAASVARCTFDDRPHRDNMDWNDGFDDGTKAAEYAIRAKAQEVKM